MDSYVARVRRHREDSVELRLGDFGTILRLKGCCHVTDDLDGDGDVGMIPEDVLEEIHDRKWPVHSGMVRSR